MVAEFVKDAGGVGRQVAYAKGIPIVKKVGGCRRRVEVPALLASNLARVRWQSKVVIKNRL